MKGEELTKAHRWFGVEFNNSAWNLLEQSERSKEETWEMIHKAHAALLHWGAAGGEINRLRALSLLSYVYSAAGDGNWAERFADESLMLLGTRPEGLEDWDAPFIYDAAARAAELVGDSERGENQKVHARKLGEEIVDDQDREIFMRTWSLTF